MFTQAFSGQAFVRAMLDFERALAAAEAEVGVIPQGAARVIASNLCRTRWASSGVAATVTRSISEIP